MSFKIQLPSRDDYATYLVVRNMLERNNVADFLNHREPDATPEKFERMCSIYSEFVSDDGEHDLELLCEAWAWQDVL